MKRRIQLVALAIVAVLSVPPSFAEGICEMLQAGLKSTMAGCCMSMDHPSTVGQTSGNSAAVSLEAQACNSNCCTVSPQTPPYRSVSYKAKSESNPVERAIAISVPTCETRIFRASESPETSPTPRHILLKTLRI